MCPQLWAAASGQATPPVEKYESCFPERGCELQISAYCHIVVQVAADNFLDEWRDSGSTEDGVLHFVSCCGPHVGGRPLGSPREM